MAKRSRKGTYLEGDWFAVPLRTSGYAVGLVARAKRHALLGYFFGPRRQTVPEIIEMASYSSEDAILVALLGDLGLHSGEWPIIGRLPNWNRSSWPMPTFARVDVLDSTQCLKVAYSDDDPTLAGVISEMPCTPAEAAELPRDAMSGYGAIELELTDLLDG